MTSGNDRDATAPFVSLDLARRLERAEARSNAASVEARARLSPATGACWIEVAGAYAMYDGPASPMTQTFGLGLFAEVGDGELTVIEAFFRDRGAPVLHEVSPLAGVSLAGWLHLRGYRPVEFTNVMFRPIAAGRLDAPPNARLAIRIVARDEGDVWAKTAAAGWAEFPEFEPFMRDIAQVTLGRADASCFLATLDGRPIATGVLDLRDGIALFGGASTVPEARGQGAQLALLDARLRLAADRGCDLAMMCALPGSASQRNAERHGFRTAYTRIKWQML